MEAPSNRRVRSRSAGVTVSPSVITCVSAVGAARPDSNSSSMPSSITGVTATLAGFTRASHWAFSRRVNWFMRREYTGPSPIQGCGGFSMCSRPG